MSIDPVEFERLAIELRSADRIQKLLHERVTEAQNELSAARLRYQRIADAIDRLVKAAIGIDQ